MTYRELLKELQEISDEQLDQRVTVHVEFMDEYYPVEGVCVAVEDVGDAGHVVLATGDYG